MRHEETEVLIRDEVRPSILKYLTFPVGNSFFLQSSLLDEPHL